MNKHIIKINTDGSVNKITYPEEFGISFQYIEKIVGGLFNILPTLASNYFLIEKMYVDKNVPVNQKASDLQKFNVEEPVHGVALLVMTDEESEITGFDDIMANCLMKIVGEP